jgi:hypothetical protein
VLGEAEVGIGKKTREEIRRLVNVVRCTDVFSGIK